MTVPVEAVHEALHPFPRDEYCVLTREEYVAVEDAMLWAMVTHKCDAESREARDAPEGFTARVWLRAAEAGLALAILRGTRDRTFDSHYPSVAS